MNRKKTIKQLMAIGVQRNEAVAFARAYRKIMDAKREDLFPEIVKPVMPIMGTVNNYQVTPIRARFVAHDELRYVYHESSVDFAAMIEAELSKQIAYGLMQSGAFRMERRAIGYGTEYMATVNVVIV